MRFVLFCLNNTYKRSTFFPNVNFSYSKIPFLASGAFSTEIVNVINVDLEENIWNYRDGKCNFDDCMNSLHMNKCVSIFDSRPLKNP